MGRNLWIKQLREEDGDLPQSDPSSEIPAEEQLRQIPKEPRVINIGGKATIVVGKGDRLVIETPGGGGWGTAEEAQKRPAGLPGIVGQVKDWATNQWEARGSLAERAAAQAGF